MKRILACIAITLFSGLLVSAAFFTRVEFLDRLELISYDLRMKARGVEYPSDKVVIVAIDEESLQKIGRFPWSRATFAKLARQLDAYEPIVVGYDIVFAEPEEGTPAHPDPDGEFAKALRESKAPQILGYVVNAPDVPAAPKELENAAQYSFRNSGTLKAWGVDRALLTLPRLANGAHSQGYINISSEQDGAVRNYLVLLKHGDAYLQPLAAAMASVVNKYTPQQTPSTKNADQGIHFGKVMVPTDAWGRMLLNFRGPEGTIPHVSAWKVLQGEVDDDLLKGKFILVGGTAFGIKDINTTPIGMFFPSVEIHATALDNIVDMDFMVKPYWSLGMEFALIWVMCILAAIISSTLKRPWSFLSFIVVFVAYVLVSYYQVVINQFLTGMVYPLAGLTVTYLLLLGIIGTKRTSLKKSDSNLN